MRVIGITGGVGAGKSAILKYLTGMPGVRVVEADEVGPPSDGAGHGML